MNDNTVTIETDASGRPDAVTLGQSSRWDQLAHEIAEQWIAQRADAGQPLDEQQHADTHTLAVFVVQAVVAVHLNIARFGHPAMDIVDALAAGLSDDDGDGDDGTMPDAAA